MPVYCETFPEVDLVGTGRILEVYCPHALVGGFCELVKVGDSICYLTRSEKGQFAYRVIRREENKSSSCQKK